MKTLLKVLRDGLASPYKNFRYTVGKEYTCKDFDDNPKKDRSRGYYAVDVEGLPYMYRPDTQIWWCEVGGKEVEYDIYKRRYEKIRITHQANLDEIKQMAVSRERECGYKLSEVLFPINPLNVFTNEEATEEIVTQLTLDQLREWTAVRAFIWGYEDYVLDSVHDSVRDSVWESDQDYVLDYVQASMRASVWASVQANIQDYDQAYVRDSAWDFAWAYTSSLFPDIEKWKYIDHEPGVNPFQAGIDLWKSGFVPSFDGKKWRLHAGPKAKVVWEEK